MNVYANRTPEIPDQIAKNISIRLIGVLNGSGINETQGERLLEICKECWGSGWQHGHFVMDQIDTQETNTIDGHLESQYENVTNYGGTE